MGPMRQCDLHATVRLSGTSRYFCMRFFFTTVHRRKKFSCLKFDGPLFCVQWNFHVLPNNIKVYWTRSRFSVFLPDLRL